jgi:hypothetical protein
MLGTMNIYDVAYRQANILPAANGFSLAASGVCLREQPPDKVQVIICTNLRVDTVEPLHAGWTRELGALSII